MVFLYGTTSFLFCVSVAQLFVILNLLRKRDALLQELGAAKDLLSTNESDIEKLKQEKTRLQESLQDMSAAMKTASDTAFAGTEAAAAVPEHSREIMVEKTSESSGIENKENAETICQITIPNNGAEYKENISESEDVKLLESACTNISAVDDSMVSAAIVSSSHENNDAQVSSYELSNGNHTRFKDVNILVCDDHEQSREVIGGMLSEFKITPEFTINGAECVNVLDGGKMFDLIFMDLQMPVMDGYEATRIIRSNSKYDSTPIISLTANVMRAVADKCLETGMNDHIAKPVEFDRLEYVLIKWLPENKKI
ncbi:MAG: response regulator [Chitinispirillales bacterium]|jgi:CheY-like chemotaxis protein|nr:response regulator [Chitinispirillales bacterium]